MNELDFLTGGSVKVARQLIGWRLFVVDSDGTKVGGTIIETEAYNQDDAASHSYRGKTPRTEVMFGPAGRAYVYFSYGLHWCMNIVTGPPGRGEAVLIRAIVPELGIEKMRQRRRATDLQLTNGPAKTCQALRVTNADNAAVINKSRILLEPPLPGSKLKTTATPRIGIKKDADRLWRFVVREQ